MLLVKRNKDVQNVWRLSGCATGHRCRLAVGRKNNPKSRNMGPKLTDMRINSLSLVAQFAPKTRNESGDHATRPLRTPADCRWFNSHRPTDSTRPSLRVESDGELAITVTTDINLYYSAAVHGKWTAVCRLRVISTNLRVSRNRLPGPKPPSIPTRVVTERLLKVTGSHVYAVKW